MDFLQIIIDISTICIFLLVGAIVRTKVRIFQRYVIPASVIGGIIGLILGHNVLAWVPTSQAYVKYAGALINILFAGLFIGRKIPSIGKLGRIAGAQTAFAVFNNFGQIGVGMLVVIVFGLFGFALHPTFGMQLILGYQGGVGIPTAFAPMFGKLGWTGKEAAAVGETCAIMGMILAILIGVIWVNIGIARNFTVRKFHEMGRTIESPTFLPETERKPLGKQIANTEALSNLGLNFAFMAIAIILGKLIQMGLVGAFAQLRFVPLFPFVLVGGMILQLFLQKTNLDTYVDRDSVGAISSVALDVLIVASLVAINLKIVIMFALPLIVMIVLGLVFNIWQIMWMAPRVLPGAWFEKSICEYGQGTGSTPQALLLLKIVDPQFETDAAEAFGLKMFFTSPTMVPMLFFISPLVVSQGPLTILIAYIILMAALLGICRILCWEKRPEVKWFGKRA